MLWWFATGIGIRHRKDTPSKRVRRVVVRGNCLVCWLLMGTEEGLGMNLGFLLAGIQSGSPHTLPENQLLWCLVALVLRALVLRFGFFVSLKIEGRGAFLLNGVPPQTKVPEGGPSGWRATPNQANYQASKNHGGWGGGRGGPKYFLNKALLRAPFPSK